MAYPWYKYMNTDHVSTGALSGAYGAVAWNLTHAAVDVKTVIKNLRIIAQVERAYPTLWQVMVFVCPYSMQASMFSSAPSNSNWSDIYSKFLWFRHTFWAGATASANLVRYDQRAIDLVSTTDRVLNPGDCIVIVVWCQDFGNSANAGSIFYYYEYDYQKQGQDAP